jgi:hypothetical protein
MILQETAYQKINELLDEINKTARAGIFKKSTRACLFDISGITLQIRQTLDKGITVFNGGEGEA